ncbi:hypothetical protein PV08_11847 [Exophiala spinifera]|uniref:C2H2 type master regulator of conidiophore development brlA n=1 Tax=Exophiala spinifera TaxID=91928 RepID=A0A0D1Y579_9EURO|nr:uncharacterized protein PV08_11847 [Exophiala spinifera]KIW10071.1 hypothetical protein PV08_11847 [Exophiala spinifera]
MEASNGSDGSDMSLSSQPYPTVYTDHSLLNSSRRDSRYPKPVTSTYILGSWKLNKILEYPDHGKFFITYFHYSVIIHCQYQNCEYGSLEAGLRMLPLDAKSEALYDALQYHLQNIEFGAITFLTLKTIGGTLEVQVKSLHERSDINGNILEESPSVSSRGGDLYQRHNEESRREGFHEIDLRTIDPGTLSCPSLASETPTTLRREIAEKYPRSKAKPTMVDDNFGAIRQKIESAPKAFASRSEIARHKLIHSGIKPHACDFEGCGKRFTRRPNLTRHMRVHTGEKPYMCERCSKNQQAQLILSHSIQVNFMDIESLLLDPNQSEGSPGQDSTTIDIDSTATGNYHEVVQVSEESIDSQATDQRFSYEQLLLILSCLYVTTGDHYRTGDERPLDDIIQRHPETWTRTLDKESWKSVHHAFNSISSTMVASKELKLWRNIILDKLQRLPDQSIPPIIPEQLDWDWERSAHLVCLHYGVSSADPDMSKFWDEERFTRLTEKLSGSAMFPNSLTLGELKSAVNSLALLLGKPAELNPSLFPLMIPRDRTKRSAEGGLGGRNAKIPRRRP